MRKIIFIIAVSFIAFAHCQGQPKVMAEAFSVNTTQTKDTLQGTACDCLGTISSWIWTKVSGPGLQTMNGAASAQMIVSGLQTGSYIWNLQVTNDKGLINKDTVGFTVKIPVVIPPTSCDTVSILKKCPPPSTVYVHDTIIRINNVFIHDTITSFKTIHDTIKLPAPIIRTILVTYSDGTTILK